MLRSCVRDVFVRGALRKKRQIREVGRIQIALGQYCRNGEYANNYRDENYRDYSSGGHAPSGTARPAVAAVIAIAVIVAVKFHVFAS